MSLQNTLKALGDPTRREILTLLRRGRMAAGEIGEHFPVSAAAISRHLSVLKEAGLIHDEREGKFIFYELNTSVLEEVMWWISELKGENTDEDDAVENMEDPVVGAGDPPADAGGYDPVVQAAGVCGHAF